MASGQLVTVKMMRGDNSSPWGFRLQGGKDYSIPLSVVKVNPGTLADQGGLIVGDVVVQINGKNADLMRHKEAQDVIFNTGNNLEMTIQRAGMTTWKPSVTPVGDFRTSGRLIGEPNLLTKTSLAHDKQNVGNIGSGHNTSAKPFNSPGMPLINKQYNSPINIYSEKAIKESIEAHTEVLSSGVLGINFMKPDAPVNTASPVYQMVHDEEVARSMKGETNANPEEEGNILNGNADKTQLFSHVVLQMSSKQTESEKETLHDALEEESSGKSSPNVAASTTFAATRHVEAPITRPMQEKNEKTDQNICEECGRAIVGVFVRVCNKSLHPECFRCATCGTSLKNVGYFNINDKLYCDIHAKQVANIMSPGTEIRTVPIVQESKFCSNTGYGTSPANISIPIQTAHPQPSGLSSPGVVGAMPYHNIQQAQVHHVQAPSALSSSYSSSYSSSFIPQPVLSKPQQTPSYGAQSTSDFQRTGQSFMPGSRPAPRRGRGLLQSQISGGTIPICSHCSTSIRGPFIVALNKAWCPEHFKCANSQCRRSIQEIGFVEEQGQLYCENCYEQYFAPMCAKCHTRVKGDCLNALDKQWHPNCFICACCKKPFGNSSFYLEDGLPYCERDWNQLFTTKCIGCGFAIEAGDRWVEALSQNYHSQCFKCYVCARNLEGQSFYAKGGRPYCKSHAR